MLEGGRLTAARTTILSFIGKEQFCVNSFLTAEPAGAGPASGLPMAKGNNVYKDAYNRCLGLLESTGNLPSEPELGAALGVSRTTVRSILARMEETGLITRWLAEPGVRIVSSTDGYAEATGCAASLRDWAAAARSARMAAALHQDDWGMAELTRVAPTARSRVAG